MWKCNFKAVVQIKSCSVQERRGCQVTRAPFTTKGFKCFLRNVFHRAAPKATLEIDLSLQGLKRACVFLTDK